MEFNVIWAQGGIASAVDESDIPAHIQDALTAGVNYNWQSCRSFLSKKSISTIKFNWCWNEIDLKWNGELAYTKSSS